MNLDLTFSSEFLNGSTVRLLIVVDDAHAVFAGAVATWAYEIRPVHEEYGWLLGRLVYPLGDDWEIGKPLGPGVGEE